MSVSFSLVDCMCPGMFVDIWDSQMQTWTTAYIESVDSNGLIFCVDENQIAHEVPHTSQKIEPFRCQTKGEVRQSLLNPPRKWLNLDSDIQEIHAAVSAVNFKNTLAIGKRPYDLVQKIRGKMYFLVDELTGKPDLTLPEQRALCKLSDMTVQLLMDWFTAYAWVVPELYELIKLPNKYLYDEKAALASMWPEIFAMTSNLLNCRVDVTAASRQISPENPRQTMHTYTSDILQLRNSTSITFTCMQTAIESFDTTSPVFSQFPVFLLPKLPIWSLLSHQPTRDSLFTSIRKRISRYSDTDCEINSSEDVMRLFECFQLLSEQCYTLEVLENDQILIFSVAQKMIKLEKCKNEGLKLMAKFSDCEKPAFRRFFLRENIMEMIVNCKFPAELLQKHQYFFDNLAKMEIFDSEIVNFLLNTSEFSPVFAEILAKSAKFMSNSQLKEFYGLLKAYFSISSKISLIEIFMDSAKDAILAKNYDLNPFFILDFSDFLRTNPKFDSKLVNSMKKSLLNWVLNEPFAAFAETLFFSYLEELNSLYEPQFELLISIFQQFSVERRLVLLGKYEQIAKMTLPSSLIRDVFLNFLNEKPLLTVAFHFFDIILASNPELSELNERIWTTLIQNYEKNKRDCLFLWLKKTKSLSKTAFVTVYKVLISMEVENMSNSAFKCAKKLILMRNYEAGNVEIAEKGEIQRTKLGDFVDFEKLLEFLFKSNSEKIRAKVVVTLCDLLTSTSKIKGKAALRGVFSKLLPWISSANSGLLELLNRYVTRIGEITTSAPHTPGGNLVYFLCEGDTEWSTLEVTVTATISTVRRAVSHLRSLPAQRILLTYEQHIYSFAQDHYSLLSLPHHLHFTVRPNQRLFSLLSLQKCFNCDIALLKSFSNTLLPPSASDKQIWFLAHHLICSHAVQIRLREVGESLFGLLEGSLGEMMLGLLAVDSLRSDPDFVSGVKKRCKDCFLRILERSVSIDSSILSPFLQVKLSDLTLNALSLVSPKPSDSVEFLKNIFSLLQMRLCVDEPVTTCISPPTIQTLLTVFEGNFPTLTQSIPTFPHFRDLFLASFIQIKAKSETGENDMCEFYLFLSKSPVDLICQIIDISHENLQFAINNPQSSLAFSSLLTNLIQIDNRDYSHLFEYFIQQITAITEGISENQQHNGLVLCLKYLLSLVKKRCINNENLRLLAQMMISGLICEEENLAQISPFQSYLSRNTAFEIVAEIMKFEVCREEIGNCIKPIFSDLSWRSGKMSNWNRPMNKVLPRKSEFIGLKNLGSTCYFNSVIQQLYGISAFKAAIFALEIPSDPSPDLQLISQIHRIFTGLLLSDKSRISPRRLISLHQQIAGKIEGFLIQSDASECLMSVLNQLKETCERYNFRSVSDLFAFRMERKTEPECGHMTETSEYSLNLMLNIEGFETISAALESCFATEIMDESNAYECSTCRKKRIAQRKQVISAPPSYLILALNRFMFDPNVYERRKITSSCEVPVLLDVSRYIGQGNGEYRLQGVVLHTGTPDNGHYTSIRRCKEKWILCDDSVTMEIEQKAVLEMASGVSAESAYVLLYEQTEAARDEFTWETHPSVPTQHLKNTHFWRKIRVFSPEFRNFVFSLSSDISTFYSLILSYFYTIFIRMDTFPVSFLTELHQYLSIVPEMSLFSLSIFTHPCLFNELILQCPDSLKRKTLISFLLQSYLHCPSLPAQNSFLSTVTSTRIRLPALPTKEQQGLFELIYRLTTLLGINNALLYTSIAQIIGNSVDFTDFVHVESEWGYENGTNPSYLLYETTPEMTYIAALCNFAVKNNSQDIIFVLKNEDFVRKLVFYSNSRLGANSISDFMIKLTELEGNFDGIFRMYYGILVEKMQNNRSEDYKYVLLQIKRILVAFSSNFEAVSGILSPLEDYFRINLNRFIRPTELQVLFFHRVCSKSVSANRWLLEHPDLVQLLVEWVGKYQQCRVGELQGLVLGSDTLEFSQKVSVIEAANALLSQELGECCDSEEEVEVAVGRSVEMKTRDRRYAVEVKYSLGAVVVLQHQEEPAFLQATDSEELR